MNLIQKVFEEMETDCDANDRQAELIEEYYTTATKDQQKVVDDVFIALCGWSLKTLIDKK